jgi:hypothetical protein
MINLPKVIGLPPVESGDDKTKTKIQQSFPIMRVYPMEPDFGKALQIYRLKPSMAQFKSILNKYGYNLNSGFQYLELAFINEGSISESFSSDFGDSFVESMANAVSDKFLDARQLLGVGSVQDMEKKITNGLNTLADKLPVGGDLVKAAGEGATKILQMGESNSLTRSLKNVLIGNKIDMPSIWKGSSASMDYGVTIRLYNPYPGNDEMFEKYIVGPLVALLLFVMPRSNDGVSYRWPFYCKIEAPGMFFLKYAAIKDMSITKGGDSAAFTYDQRPTLVDIKLTFSELHNVRLVMEDGSASDSGIPTLKDYIDNILSFKMSSLDGHYTPEYVNNYATGSFAEDEKLATLAKLKKSPTTDQQRPKTRVATAAADTTPQIKKATTSTPPSIEKVTEEKIYGIPVSQLKDYKKKQQQQETPEEREKRVKDYISKTSPNPYGISDEQLAQIKQAQSNQTQDATTQTPTRTDTLDVKAQETIDNQEKTKQYEDTNPNDSITRVGKNSYMDHANKKIVISKNDLEGDYMVKPLVEKFKKEYPDYTVKVIA